MNIPRPSLLLALALTAGIGGGCLNLKPQPDGTRFYVLAGPMVDAAPAGAALAGGLPVFLGRVEIPDYLQVPGIATRVGGTEMVFSDHHHWAEPLREGVTRVLRDTLAAHCGAERIHPASFRRPAGPYLEVQVGFTRFECEANGSGVGAARWSLLLQPGSQPIAGGESVMRHDFNFEPDDYRSAVTALSQCLHDLGEELAGRCLEPTGP